MGGQRTKRGAGLYQLRQRIQRADDTERRDPKPGRDHDVAQCNYMVRMAEWFGVHVALPFGGRATRPLEQATYSPAATRRLIE